MSVDRPQSSRVSAASIRKWKAGWLAAKLWMNQRGRTSGGGVGDDGGESLKLMGVDAGVGSSEGTLGQVGPRDATDVTGKEVHVVLADVEVGHEPVVIGNLRGAVRCEKEGGSGVGVGEVTLQLCESLLELGEGLLEVGSSLEVGLGGDIGVIVGTVELNLGGGVSILGQLSKFFRQSESSFVG